MNCWTIPNFQAGSSGRVSHKVSPLASYGVTDSEPQIKQYNRISSHTVKTLQQACSTRYKDETPPTYHIWHPTPPTIQIVEDSAPWKQQQIEGVCPPTIWAGGAQRRSYPWINVVFQVPILHHIYETCARFISPLPMDTSNEKLLKQSSFVPL